MRAFKCFLLVLALCLSAPGVFSQSVSLDHVDGLVDGDPNSILVGENVVFYIRLTNPTDSTYIVIGNGFRVHSPNGAVWESFDGFFLNSFEDNFVKNYVNKFSDDGAGADTIGFSGISFSADEGLLPGFDGVTYSIEIGPFATSEHGKTVCLDSSFYPPGGTWKWTNPSQTVYPTWDGPHCYQIFDPNAPLGNLVLSTDTLMFEGQQGGSNPDAQSFEIASDGAPLTLSISESASWLLLDKASGLTPETVTVSVNTTGLAVGLYTDSITVTSPGVTNSPQFVHIILEVTPPPAEIAVDPQQFFFNAVAGGDNPSPQILTIKNLGGVPLTWTASNGQSWLQLTPSSGIDSTDVVLDVDIAGLSYDTYYDTIVVEDPLAVNSPVMVPVTLTVGSDLPLIEIDAKALYIVPMSELPLFTRGFQVLNGGAGTMTFAATYASSRIDSISVGSGTAPDSAILYFDVKSVQEGEETLDTVWISSNEAINSPQPVAVRLRFVQDPAVLALSHDTITFDVYQCYQGFGHLLPQTALESYNLGGDDPLEAYLEFESELFTATVDPISSPPTWDFRALTPSLPVGSYFDSVWVVAEKAINSPLLLIVNTNVLPRYEPPELMLLRDEITIYQNVNVTPTDYFATMIVSVNGGCLDWFADEVIPWLAPLEPSGTVPSYLNVRIGPLSVSNGYHMGSLFVVAPDASNTPQEFRVTLFAWTYRGDVDANGLIDIADITKLIQYIFMEGNPPRPVYAMGDTNCDSLVDVGDLTLLIEYLFINGPPPCTDPLQTVSDQME
ncbi:MAG: hypothetical protein JSU65_01995 [Candidatus Zixiibacteriota bacterium]|nr:MAG: hypothetical protein JSU65_01995 [candidate division Zixibacteria bacterium]